MANTDYQSVDEYIASQPEAVREILERVRNIIRKAAPPKAEEVISYQIPAYKLNGERLIYFAGWKKHYSLYPATDLVVTTFQRELEPYKLSRGTIRFPLSEPIPVKLIERIAKLRAKEVAARVKEKAAVPQNRDRGKPRGSAPPTPPDMRVRIRRFGGFSYQPPVNLGIPSESK